MLTVYDCIVTAHDLWLVGLAAVICTLASFTAISLLHHVRSSTGHMRLIWLAVSATSTGFGIWATHFIAMLAFSPGLPTAYNIVLTILSLIVAIFLTGAGLAAGGDLNIREIVVDGSRHTSTPPQSPEARKVSRMILSAQPRTTVVLRDLGDTVSPELHTVASSTRV